MTEKEILFMMTLLDILGKPTHPNRIQEIYEMQKDWLARRDEPSLYETDPHLKMV